MNICVHKLVLCDDILMIVKLWMQFFGNPKNRNKKNRIWRAKKTIAHKHRISNTRITTAQYGVEVYACFALVKSFSRRFKYPRFHSYAHKLSCFRVVVVLFAPFSHGCHSKSALQACMHIHSLDLAMCKCMALWIQQRGRERAKNRELTTSVVFHTFLADRFAEFFIWHGNLLPVTYCWIAIIVINSFKWSHDKDNGTRPNPAAKSIYIHTHNS